MKLTVPFTLDDLRAAMRFAGNRLREDRLFDAAGSLTFTTVLAVVPLLTVALALFTAFPLFEQFRINLQEYFIKSLMPDSISKAVLNYLNIFASKAARISAVGGVFLFVTSLALIFSIDRTFNTIWRVRRPRSFFKRLITYWAAITVGPLMIGASITLTTVLFSQASKGTDGWLDSREWLCNIFPLIFSVAAFALLYRMLPAKPVRWNDALAGGLIAGIAFEIAKRLFALFIAKFPTYTAVYGAFAAVPIFLLWVYLSWLIILFGAAVTATIAVLKYERWNRRAVSGEVFIDALELLRELVQVREVPDGRVASMSLRELRKRTRLGLAESEALLEKMLAQGWVARLAEHAPRAVAGVKLSLYDADDERWALIVDPGTIRLAAVFNLFNLEAAAQQQPHEAVTRAAAAVHQTLNESLAEYFDSDSVQIP
ncbi:MAG: YihY family inner membrane protein [Burkholderiales bacterium]